jgi:hypothetical protein
MDLESETRPSGESCMEGFTFYDLRPYFTATHYDQKPLPRNMAIHMQGCNACRKRWKFLVRTDPKASAHYWEELETVQKRVAETEERGTGKIAVVHPAVQQLIESGSGVLLPEVRDAWRAVSGIDDDAERLQQAINLSVVCDRLLKLKSGGSKVMAAFLDATHNMPSGTAIPIETAEQMLFLASLASTSYIRDYKVAEFDDSGGRWYPDRYLRAEELYDSHTKKSELLPG